MGSCSSRRGFTLIELLIVVAIIAILAAIAVPNFLAAQVRSKVSRVKSDQRTLATALESYMVDYNRYPGDQDNNPNHATERGFYKLTTPVAYITTLASDPFSDRIKGADPNNPDVAAFYAMACGSDNPANRLPSHNYVILSLGPDRKDSADNGDEFPTASCVFGQYDPTNGTVSFGDVLRLGGNYRYGFWRLAGDAKGQSPGIPADPGQLWSNWNVTDVIPQ